MGVYNCRNFFVSIERIKEVQSLDPRRLDTSRPSPREYSNVNSTVGLVSVDFRVDFDLLGRDFSDFTDNHPSESRNNVTGKVF